MQSFINRPPMLCGSLCKFPPISLAGLLAEPCLLNCSVEGVMASGGPLQKQVMEHILACYGEQIVGARKEGLSACIDVRVQRLMPGMYPSIPGWHCDAVPRSNYHGQPVFDAIPNRSFHVAVTLSNEPNGVSNTEYVFDRMKAVLWDSDHVYKDLHRQVEKLKPHTRCIPDGQFVKFCPRTIHRATPTHRRGVRMFFRFSMLYKPPLKNGVNVPQQVYLLSEENGW